MTTKLPRLWSEAEIEEALAAVDAAGPELRSNLDRLQIQAQRLYELQVDDTEYGQNEWHSLEFHIMANLHPESNLGDLAGLLMEIHIRRDKSLGFQTKV